MKNHYLMLFLLVGGLFSILLYGFTANFKPTPYQYPKLLHFPKMVQTQNPPTIEGVKLGRYLFYDSILSKDSTISCASCHNQKYAFSDSPQTFSKGINGNFGTRNTMPLFNLQWYSDFFWDGNAKSMEEQALHPVKSPHEMDLNWEIASHRIKNNDFYIPKFYAAFGNQAIDSITISKAIAQFEKTLISHNSKYDKVLRGESFFTAKEYEGFILMNDQTKGNCLHCHTTDANALGTTTKFSNNGLDDYTRSDEYKDKGKATVSHRISDVGLFKIPSLRNVGVTAPYMHDGRFQTLQQVLDFYSKDVKNSFNVDSKMGLPHRKAQNLTEQEQESIIAFLLTLTDSVFVNNPEFSNPFEEVNK